jgi:hypothetical protein
MDMPSWTHDAVLLLLYYNFMKSSTRLLGDISQRKEENLDRMDEDSYLQEMSRLISKTERLTAKTERLTAACFSKYADGIC